MLDFTRQIVYRSERYIEEISKLSLIKCETSNANGLITINLVTKLKFIQKSLLIRIESQPKSFLFQNFKLETS